MAEKCRLMGVRGLQKEIETAGQRRLSANSGAPQEWLSLIYHCCTVQCFTDWRPWSSACELQVLVCFLKFIANKSAALFWSGKKDPYFEHCCLIHRQKKRSRMNRQPNVHVLVLQKPQVHNSDRNASGDPNIRLKSTGKHDYWWRGAHEPKDFFLSSFGHWILPDKSYLFPPPGYNIKHWINNK